MKNIKVISRYFASYAHGEQEIKMLLKNSFIDVVLIETPIEVERYWTDIFMRSPEIGEKIREALKKKKIEVLDLMPDKFLGRVSKDLICLNAISRARRIKDIIELES